MKNPILTFILIFIIVMMILKYMCGNKEHFCPTSLTIEKNKYILWKNNKVLKVFNSYLEYIKYYYLSQIGFTKKCIFCKPLTVSYDNKNKTSDNPMEKNWFDRNINPKLFNIEYFADSGCDSECQANKQFHKTFMESVKIYINKFMNCRNNNGTFVKNKYIEIFFKEIDSKLISKLNNYIEKLVVNGKINLVEKYKKPILLFEDIKMLNILAESISTIDNCELLVNKYRQKKEGFANPINISNIKSVSSGLCITGLINKNSDNSIIQQNKCKNNRKQHWIYNKKNKSIRNPYSNKCLDVNGRKIVQRKCNNSKTQKWKYQNKFKRIKSMQTNKCIAVKNNAKDEGSQYIQVKCNKRNNQKFDLLDVSQNIMAKRDSRVKEKVEKLVNDYKEKIKRIIKDKISRELCKCYNNSFIYDSVANKCVNPAINESKDICKVGSNEIHSESVVVEEENNNMKEKLIQEISILKEKYIIEQPDCFKRIEKNDKNYYKQLSTASANYQIKSLKDELGYIPNVKSENEMNVTELNAFLKVIKNKPKCDDLIKNYYKASILSEDCENLKEKVVKEEANISKIKDLMSRVKNLENKIDNNKVDTSMKYIEQEKEMKKIIEEENKNYKEITEDSKNLDKTKRDDGLLKDKKYFVKSDTKDFGINEQNKAKNLIDNEHKNFTYQNKIAFDHQEPSKKIVSAYGWSYMPPQFWSVPQKRPPSCIPQKGHEAKVRPILDKGVPVDALDYTKVGSILPKFEYKEVYNPDYYYPGWKSQDKINYPDGNKKFSNKYYNYNKAIRTDN